MSEGRGAGTDPLLSVVSRVLARLAGGIILFCCALPISCRPKSLVQNESHLFSDLPVIPAMAGIGVNRAEPLLESDPRFGGNDGDVL